MTNILVLGVGGVALVGAAVCIWELSRATYMSADMEASVTLSLPWHDDDAAAVLDAARDVIESAAGQPYSIFLAHVWPRVRQVWT